MRLSRAHTDADKRFAEIQRDTYEEVMGLPNDGRLSFVAEKGRCDAGKPVEYKGETHVLLVMHGDMMCHVSITDLEFEYETARFNAYRFLCDVRCFGAEFAVKSLWGMWS